MNRDDAIAKLRVECHRLNGALDRFYSHDLPGDPVAMEAEALNLSMPIRVLVHHVPEKQSMALLNQIDPGYWSKLIHFRPLIAPPPQTLPSGVQSMNVSIPLNVTLSVRGGRTRSGAWFTRYRGGKDAGSKVPLKNWWFDPCWDSGTNKVSNKDIVLALANKEGGAHVHDDMAANYKAAKSQGRIIVAGKPVSDLARLGSLVALAGDELFECIRDNYPEC